MANVKAYALHTIHRRDEKNTLVVVPASEKGKISVFDVPKDEFDRLSKLGAVREATKDEIAIAKANADRENGTVDTSSSADTTSSEPNTAPGDASGTGTAPNQVDPNTAGSNAPSSGAKGDPNAAPKGSKKAADDGI